MSGRAASGRCSAGCWRPSPSARRSSPTSSLEYRTLDFRADDGPYGSIYWVLTGLHGAHVTAGLAAMALLFVRAVRSRTPAAVASWAGGVSLFWHLVDVVWIFVFTTIWILQ